MMTTMLEHLKKKKTKRTNTDQINLLLNYDIECISFWPFFRLIKTIYIVSIINTFVERESKLINSHGSFDFNSMTWGKDLFGIFLTIIVKYVFELNAIYFSLYYFCVSWMLCFGMQFYPMPKWMSNLDFISVCFEITFLCIPY